MQRATPRCNLQITLIEMGEPLLAVALLSWRHHMVLLPMIVSIVASLSKAGPSMVRASKELQLDIQTSRITMHFQAKEKTCSCNVTVELQSFWILSLRVPSILSILKKEQMCMQRLCN